MPDYMLPTALVALERLPLTANGKVDRRALPAPDRAQAQGEETVAPRTPVEALIAGVWADLLGRDRVGVHDDFFALGGHSLLAAQVVSRLRATFGIELPLRTLFAEPTVAGLAPHVEEARRAGLADAPPVRPLPRPLPCEGGIPLSFSQERIWLLDRMAPGLPVYNVPAALRLRGPLDTAALERALAEVVRRQEALRTVFPAPGGQPVQTVRPPEPVPLPVAAVREPSPPSPLPVPGEGRPHPSHSVGLAAFSPSPGDGRGGQGVRVPQASGNFEEALRLAREEAGRPFDLETGPLFRALLVRIAPEDHLLVLTVHHIVCDGWSLAVLFGEIEALYAASPLPEPPVQYADWALWQRERLAGGALEGQLEGWRQALAGAPEALDLPADRPRPAVQGWRGAAEPLEVSTELTARLRDLARRESSTLFMTLLAGFAALLSRYSRQDDLVLGSVVAHRRPEVEGLIGFFINTLPLRADLTGEPTFRELLARVREAALGAWERQDLPFERLVQELQPRRDPSRAPLFQVSFVFQETPARTPRLPGLETELAPLHTGTAKLDLALGLEEAGGRLTGGMEFSADLFDGATVRRMLDHLIHLLGEAVDAPERRVSEIPMLAAGEREQLLAAAAGPAGVPFPEGTVHALVERQAALTPGAVALDFEGETVTYAALNGRANRLARHLRRRGIGPDALIGVYVPRSPELVAGILGILKAGAAYLPLDLAFPRERIAAMIGDARPAALVTVDTLRAALPEGAPPAVFLDADAEALARESAADLPDVAAADNLAFVMYTSGSTGRPKGVAVTHRGLRNRFLRAQEAYRLGPDDAVLHKAPIGFDFSLWEMLGSLAAGGRTVLAKPGGHMDFPYLADLIAGRGVTIFHFVPSMMEAFLAQEGLERCAATPRLAFIGGEALTPALRDRFHSVFPIPLENQYGPTEASIDVTWQTLAPGGPHPSAAPIGRPIAFCSAHVLTPALEPTPAGVPGELHLGGVCLARGYYGRPDLTAERFIPDPFADGGRLYRTGDLVRRLPGGELEYLGRVDQQVKIHGVRIEPGEIEAALLRHPGVREAAVVAQAVAQQGRDGKRLAAFFVADPPAPGPRELRGFLGETLPDAMIPSFFTALPELPRMPNGKLDRRALSRMEAPEDAGEDFVAPRTPAEELLASVWRELLGAGRIGAHDDFFALGGHSLLAARVAARVREAFGIDLPLQALFERPTLAGLAERLDALRRAGSIPEAPPLRPAPRGEDLPLSFGQERLWFLHQLAPEDPAYNIPAAIRLEGALDPGALRAAVERIVLRHEALRTTFRSEDGRPIQRIQGIAPRLDVPLPCLDLSGSADPEDEARRRAGEEALRPFDLESGPVLRATLLRLGEREHVLLFTIHHIAADGWSLGVFVRELAALYGAAVEGREADLPELPVQYADYAVWQRGWLAGEALASRLAWWRGALAGVPALDLPADRPRPAVAGNQGAVRTLRLPGAAWGRVEALARGESVTPFMALLSAVQALLARYSGQDDFAVGSPVAGRDRVEAEGLIGFFVNTLALRGGLAGDPPFRSLLARAREATLGAYAHQDLPFEHLVEALAPERDLGRTPIFQVMLAFGNTPMPPLALPGLTLSLIETGVRASKFDLSFQTSPEGNGLRIDLVYRADLYEAATAERMLAHLSALLAAVAGAPDIRLSELPILSPAERHQLLLEWNTEWNEAPHGHAGGLVHELFAEQAARTPEAAAVVAGGGSLSYAELDRRSNRLARRLRRLGVGPEVRVGLCLETSPDALAGILGILKAGGAWVPMDPAYPAERLRWMLEDSGAPVLLTREALTASLAGTGAVLVPLDRPGDLTGEPDGPMDSGALPESTAYAIYTSGSTGRPKGTLVSHRSLVNFLAWVDERVIRGRDLPLVISLSFDACLKQLLPPLLRGGAVWIPRSTGPVELLAELATRERPVFNSVPSLWRAMLALVEAGEAAAPRLSALILGGEALDRDLVDRTLAVLPGLEIWNVYGPTEATSNAAHARIGAGPIVIGRPAAGARLAVLGRDLEPQPAGVPGELAIGGPGLARGYLDRPGLTAERFIPDPFAALHGSLGARLYRTGDLVRRAMNGDVEFLGRLDHQVKIRGFRIEPGEVETALAGHPAVEQCVAVARRDGGEPRLVAYVVPRGEAASAPSLRAFLAERLPPFLVPAAFVFLPALPLTPTGKIDRRALPAPVAEPAAGEAAPLTPAQELIAGVWADLLGVEIAGAEAHFFELGGHSLLATQAVSRLRAAFGVDLPLRALFEAPTVAALAARVEPMRAWPASSAPPLRPAPRDGDLPLSFAQERLWFLDQLEPESPLYNVPAAVSLRGDLRPEVLAAALGELVRRHEALRTTFELVGGSPRQRISPAASVPLPQVDLSALPEGVRRREAARLAAEEVRRPFDLMRGPLLRASLLRLGADEHAAVVTMHHIVSDGWSAGVLVRETAALYEALAGGWPSPLPELPVQYADFAVWQRSWLRGDALADQIAWWKEELAGAPEVLELPGDRPRPSAPTLRGRHLAVDLGEDLGGSLRALARQRGATLFMTLLAGFQALLARYVSQGGQGGQGDLLVGSPIANRNRPELEGLIGFFVNTLVLRGRTGDDPSFAELLSRARATALGAYEHQDLPFEKLVEELRPGRSAARSPLFQVALALQNAPAAALELPGLTLAPLEAESGTAKFDLTMFLRESGAGLAGSIEYASDLFDTPTVERLAGHFATLLAGAAERPEARLSELPLLTGPELRQMLLDASRTRREYPRDSPIHRLFEEQADRGPERIALVAGDERVTYGELETRANRFARRLMALGVGPETPVGVTLERGVEMIVAFLGILKAGGAYVPLDPAYPPARLELMAEELDLRLTLTEERLRAEAAAIAESDAARPEVRVDPDQLAYVMFTSGSTGRPKAVGVGHRGVVRLVRGADYAGFGPGLVFLQLAPVSFDASTLEIWGPLLNGGRLVLFSSRTPSLEDLQETLEGHGVNALWLTAGLFHQVVEARVEALRGLSQLLAGGDVLSPTAVNRVLSELPGCRMINGYGPTENTTFTCCHTVGSSVPEDRPVPIGRPIANTRVYVLDAFLQPAPAGVPGELFAGGDGLARGYLKRPELTAERFVPSPFAGLADEAGARLYRTGDRARVRPGTDGEMEILGRLDQQVKIRGFRVEPAEVEAALGRCPGVREAAVAVHTDERGSRLVAYVVPTAPDSTAPTHLRSFLRSILPEHMVPSTFVSLPFLPLSPNGKVDRRAVPVPDAAPPAGDHVAPRNAVEEMLAEIWSEVLAADRIGVHDDFFELGGHSLLAVRLVSQVRDAFGVRLQVRMIFDAPTLGEMAEKLAEEMLRQAGEETLQQVFAE
ncbi:MAG TPA: amino acid adenylation domain-containing protein [Thermoanaerobaculia bacterium]